MNKYAHLAERFHGLMLEADCGVLLAPFTTFGIGGPASLLVRPTTVEQLQLVATETRAVEGAIRTIGQGSNLLVSDGGFDGVVVVLGGDFTRVEQLPERDGSEGAEALGSTVRTGGAAKLPVVARQTVAMGLTGFEWAVGVPGSIGGGVRMNAGGHGSDMAASVQRVVLVSMESADTRAFAPDDLQFGYRTSAIGDDDVVVSADLGLVLRTPRGENSEGAAEGDGELALREIVRWRREHQPGGANCGSVFTNPVGDSAGRLVDAAGLKGYRIGTASVSEKHANFIQADPHGRAADVLALIEHIRATVQERFSVTLYAEVKTLGSFGIQKTETA